MRSVRRQPNIDYQPDGPITGEIEDYGLPGSPTANLPMEYDVDTNNVDNNDDEHGAPGFNELAQRSDDSTVEQDKLAPGHNELVLASNSTTASAVSIEIVAVDANGDIPI
ncbi:hypothetical protein EC991_005442 [Linnemannia zychae]|nr:hypothetical protein EC991_005442 [Linnemannia zychae]